jgi:oligopeptide transport system ATP-binding protein
MSDATNGEAAPPQTPLLEVRDLTMHFPVTEGLLRKREVARVKAVDGVSFAVRRGEAFGLIGESGCGKSTLARCLLKLETPTEGRVWFDGRDVHELDAQETRNWRRRVQAVFQDPFSSLNPRMTVREIVGEPLLVHGVGDAGAREGRLRKLLDLCGLPRRYAGRYPHEMSGGQRQRVGIARALALEPELVILDEAVSALDVSIQAQILNLFGELRDALGLTYVFIGHDLSVVRHLCDRLAVMYLGKLAEIGTAEAVFGDPQHPYTRALLGAVPLPDPARERARDVPVIRGEVGSAMNPPSGCVFHPRCPLAVERCKREVPLMTRRGEGHRSACHLAPLAPFEQAA